MSNSAEQPPWERIHNGQYGEIRFVRIADGSLPAKDFWESLSVHEQAAFAVLFRKLAGDSQLRLANREQFKQVSGDLYEFKRINYQMRLFTFREESHWYLVCGIKGKKENKIKAGEVDKALRWMSEAKGVLKKHAAHSRERK